MNATHIPTGIEAAVCAEIAQRQAFGIAKYGVTVADNPLPLRAWLVHAYEECLDQAIYLRRAMTEIDATSGGYTDSGGRNGHYEGLFDGETAKEAATRRAVAALAFDPAPEQPDVMTRAQLFVELTADKGRLSDERIRALMAGFDKMAEPAAERGRQILLDKISDLEKRLKYQREHLRRRDKEDRARALVAPGEPFGYVVENNFPECHQYKNVFYLPSDISTAYKDNALRVTPLYAHPAPVVATLQLLAPLTDARVCEIVDATPPIRDAACEWLIFARAIERAHGIGAEVKP